MGEWIKNSGICIPEQDIFISKRVKNCSPNFKCHLIQEFAYMQSVHFFTITFPTSNYQ